MLLLQKVLGAQGTPGPPTQGQESRALQVGVASSPLLAWVMGTQMQGGQPLSGPLLGGLGAGSGAVACIHLQVDSTHKGTAGPFLLGKQEAGDSDPLSPGMEQRAMGLGEQFWRATSLENSGVPAAATVLQVAKVRPNWREARWSRSPPGKSKGREGLGGSVSLQP